MLDVPEDTWLVPLESKQKVVFCDVQVTVTELPVIMEEEETDSEMVGAGFAGVAGGVAPPPPPPPPYDGVEIRGVLGIEILEVVLVLVLLLLIIAKAWLAILFMMLPPPIAGEVVEVVMFFFSGITLIVLAWLTFFLSLLIQVTRYVVEVASLGVLYVPDIPLASVLAGYDLLTRVHEEAFLDFHTSDVVVFWFTVVFLGVRSTATGVGAE